MNSKLFTHHYHLLRYRIQAWKFFLQHLHYLTHDNNINARHACAGAIYSTVYAEIFAMWKFWPISPMHVIGKIFLVKPFTQ